MKKMPRQKKLSAKTLAFRLGGRRRASLLLTPVAPPSLSFPSSSPLLSLLLPVSFLEALFQRHRTVQIWRVGPGSSEKRSGGADVRFLWSSGMAVVQIWRQIWICGELCLFPLPPLCLIFSIWVGWFAWLKTLRVPQTVELRCFFRRLVDPDGVLSQAG